MKPCQSEDEYIWVQEMQRRMASLEKEQQAESEAEKLRLKEAHWMHCPKCGQKLSPEKCGSVEIDVCPSCKGVWLDMGELGTIVESAGQGSFFHRCLRILRGAPTTRRSNGGLRAASKPQAMETVCVAQPHTTITKESP